MMVLLGGEKDVDRGKSSSACQVPSAAALIRPGDNLANPLIPTCRLGISPVCCFLKTRL